MRRISIAVSACLLLPALAGCNTGRPAPPMAEPVAPPPAGTARLVEAPSGSGCAASISRYRSVIDNDLAMGHVNRSVYDKIQGEVSEASSACSAGDESRAMSLMRASKSRHGYPG